MNNIRTKVTWRPFVGILHIMLPDTRRYFIRLRSSPKGFLIPGEWGTAYFMRLNPQNKLKWKLESNRSYHKTHRYNKTHK
jgi:hypothetical protein